MATIVRNIALDRGSDGEFLCLSRLSQGTLYDLNLPSGTFAHKTSIFNGFEVETSIQFKNQRTNGPVNAHLISWPSKAQNIQNLENIW